MTARSRSPGSAPRHPWDTASIHVSTISGPAPAGASHVGGGIGRRDSIAAGSSAARPDPAGAWRCGPGVPMPGRLFTPALRCRLLYGLAAARFRLRCCDVPAKAFMARPVVRKLGVFAGSSCCGSRRWRSCSPDDPVPRPRARLCRLPTAATGCVTLWRRPSDTTRSGRTVEHLALGRGYGTYDTRST